VMIDCADCLSEELVLR